VPQEPLLGWGPSIRRCHQVLEPYIKEMQKPENAGPQYWAGFDWLYCQSDLATDKAQIHKLRPPQQAATAYL
jgi:hypothetical protein